MIKGLIGLGNNGKEYESTYHNVGVFVSQQISQGLGGEELFRVYEPVGFMNVSGSPVLTWLKKNNLTVAEIVVVHDESDLPIGSYKFSFGGSSAGHNGIQSLIDHLHTEDFWRLRVGIRDPREQVRKKAGDFVLTQWSKNDEEAFRSVAEKARQELKDSKVFE
jgi:PTH1 family peptidyl-tRNA hydrolase